MNFNDLSKNMEIKLNNRIRETICDIITIHENQAMNCIEWMYGDQETDPPDVPDPNNLLDKIIGILNSEQEINENIIIKRS